MSLNLDVNGEPRVFEELAPGETLLRLVEVLRLQTDRIALEVNGEIAPRSKWTSVSLSNGDRIELVHFVGGGLEFACGMRHSE